MLELNIKIEELIENNAEDFEVAKLIKSAIKEYLNSLDDIFNDTQGKDFFVKHTKKVDEFIKIIYKYLLRKHFGNYVPMRNSIPITLIALGSYGREQLCVYSDIDIMVLYKDISGFNVKPLIEELMIIAWDSGLKLGSRVHEVDELEESVQSDITIKSSVLESRLIFGSQILWYEFDRVLGKIQKYKQKEFILEKMEEHRVRLNKYPLVMQSNIKDGYGGMREANTLFWIANVIYGVSNTKELVGLYFSETEYKTYRAALEYIFRVRNALHLVAKKKLDTINFDVLPELSTKLGYKDTPRHVKERQCMSKLFASLHIIHRFTSVMIKKFIRPYLYEKESIPILRQNRFKKNLYIVNDVVYTSYTAKPKKILDILKELNSLPLSVKRFDKSYVYHISKAIVPNVLGETTKAQIKILLENLNIGVLLKLIYSAGLFQLIIPSGKKIINQPQFDGYHAYPVDVHTLKGLKHQHAIKDTFILGIYENLKKEYKSLLSMLILFHDIGKGRGRDHHIVGEHIFRQFAKSIKMSSEHIHIGARVIRYHNLLTTYATKEDIYSQKIILKFTGLVQTKDTLDLLLCVTYADIQAVGKSIYKSSTASLLRELYLQSVGAFGNTNLLKASTRRAQKETAIKNTKEYAGLSRTLQKKVLSISSTQIYLKYKAIDIINLTKKASEVTTQNYEILNDTILIIKIIRAQELNLGYLLAKLSFLDISSMDIFKINDEKKYFEMKFFQNLGDDEVTFIEEIIENSYDMQKTFKHKKPILKRSEISVNLDHTDELAEIKIQTKDQKGLFSYIAKVLDDYNVEIRSAKIYTKNYKVNDLLLIEKSDKFRNDIEEILEKLTGEL